MKSLQNFINEVLGVSLRYSPLPYEEDVGVYQFDFTPDNVCKPVWNSTADNVLVLCVCVHGFKSLVEQLCLDKIFTMTFNMEAHGLRGRHAGKRKSLKACQLYQNP